MPLHDWTRIDDEVFHDFHGSWIIELKKSLNSGRLPKGHFARSEARSLRETDGGERSENALQRRPGVNVSEKEPTEGRGLLTATAAPPQAETVLALADAGVKWRRIAVYRQKDNALVGAVEIASQANLKSRSARDYLAVKARQLAAGGVGICLIDVFPRTGRPSLEELVAIPGGEAEECRSTEAATARSDEEGLATSIQPSSTPGGGVLYFNPIRRSRELPAAPLFVADEAYLPLPLEETYAAAFSGIAEQDREALTLAG